MFGFFKKKTKAGPAKNTGASASGGVPVEGRDRAALIAEAQRNTQAAREAIGVEAIERLNRLIQEKREEQQVSPAAQARKIIALMDTDKLSDHLRYLRNEPPTRH